MVAIPEKNDMSNGAATGRARELIDIHALNLESRDQHFNAECMSYTNVPGTLYFCVPTFFKISKEQHKLIKFHSFSSYFVHVFDYMWLVI